MIRYFFLQRNFSRIPIGIAIALAFPSTVLACEISFDGSKFLQASYQRGIKARAPECHRVNLSKNTFHARPDKGCTIVLKSSSWLKNGWSFSSLKGRGSFDYDVVDDGLALTIKKEGGFVLDSITVVTSDYDCETVQMDDVLR